MSTLIGISITIAIIIALNLLLSAYQIIKYYYNAGKIVRDDKIFILTINKVDNKGIMYEVESNIYDNELIALKQFKSNTDHWGKNAVVKLDKIYLQTNSPKPRWLFWFF